MPDKNNITHLREQRQAHLDTAGYLAGVQGAIAGDCFRTAVACLLEVPRDDVPHFAQENPEPGHGWWTAAKRYVGESRPGWTLRVRAARFPVYIDPTWTEALPDRVLASGPSTRGNWNHVTLVDRATGQHAWDPHPSDAGVAEIAELYTLEPMAGDR